jgi:hypothetical protein
MANQLDPVAQKPIVDAAATVKQATLALLQQYRNIGDDLTPFNHALVDLAVQVKAFSEKLPQKVRDSEAWDVQSRAGFYFYYSFFNFIV